MIVKLDPLVTGATRWLLQLRGRFPGTGRRELTETVADRLQADGLGEYGALDVGIWGRPVYRSAAEAALRLQAVSLTGDELA